MYTGMTFFMLKRLTSDSQLLLHPKVYWYSATFSNHVDSPSKTHCFLVSLFRQFAPSPPSFLQTSYLAPILLEVRSQSKSHLRDSWVLGVPLSIQTNMYFITHACLQKTPGHSKEGSYTDRVIGMRLLFGDKSTTQLPLITAWKQQPSLHLALLHHVLNHKRLTLAVYRYIPFYILHEWRVSWIL